MNASGATGGGAINIGGGPHATVTLADAQSLLIDATSTISADATDNGNGGHIVVWSDGQTTVAGTLSAMGGPNGGNGGLIETSGRDAQCQRHHREYLGGARMAGTWLLDPIDLTIETGVTGTCRLRRRRLYLFFRQYRSRPKYSQSPR